MRKAEGIILRATDYGESNKIITLYTAEYGKIGLMARGAKKPRNPLASVSHVLFYGLCLFNKGRGLGTFYQAESLNAFTSIRTDIDKMGYAALIVELTERLCADGQPSSPIYQLLRGCLLYMEQGIDPAFLAALFSVKMLPMAGIDPRLDRCIHCGGRSAPFSFSVSGGGLLCASCAAKDPHALPISQTIARLLLLFKQIPLDRIGNVDLKRETIHAIEQIINACYEQNAGIKLRARRFIEQMDHFRAPDKK